MPCASSQARAFLIVSQFLMPYMVIVNAISLINSITIWLESIVHPHLLVHTADWPAREAGF